MYFKVAPALIRASASLRETQRNLSEEPVKTRAFAQQLMPQVQVLPGVKVAAIGSALPLEDNGRTRTPPLAFGDGPPLPVWYSGPRPTSLASVLNISLPQARACSGGAPSPIKITPPPFPLPSSIRHSPASISTATRSASNSVTQPLYGHGIFIPNTARRHRGGSSVMTASKRIVRPVIYLPFDQAAHMER